MSTKITMIGLLATLISGCATQWNNPNLVNDPAVLQQQLAIATGQCKQVALGNAPMPDIQVPTSQPSGYAISGTTNTYNSSTSNYSNGTYATTVTPVANPAQSFMGGYAQGVALGVMLRAKRNQDAVFDGCMAKLGWMPE
ncbi:hypothetical protein D8I35_10110 [Corticibacter populi]|uniref:Glycine zipper family protein n=2 Tax=Corticibacter populi TaxID=1550736 RepID=A0A3M6QUY9_9BURK|nr:hypothetical protein D8I35_10110 [Corticibacter populi]